MRSSCIIQTPKDTIAILKKSYLDITGNNKASALLLSLFEYWHNIKLSQSAKAVIENDIAEKHGEKRTQYEHLFQFHTSKELYDSFMGLVSEKAIKKGLDILEEKNYISIHKNPNPRYKFDTTKHFLLHTSVVNKALDDSSVPNRRIVQADTANRPSGYGESSTTSTISSSISSSVSSSSTQPQTSAIPSLEPETSKEVSLNNPLALGEEGLRGSWSVPPKPTSGSVTAPPEDDRHEDVESPRPKKIVAHTRSKEAVSGGDDVESMFAAIMKPDKEKKPEEVKVKEKPSNAKTEKETEYKSKLKTLIIKKVGLKKLVSDYLQDLEIGADEFMDSFVNYCYDTDVNFNNHFKGIPELMEIHAAILSKGENIIPEKMVVSQYKPFTGYM